MFIGVRTHQSAVGFRVVFLFITYFSVIYRRGKETVGDWILKAICKNTLKFDRSFEREQ
ncbi:hypothetical protein NT05HA_1844 [Aggregatibacter aphrophilus NJ8700]|nr:hypothetical protein NT05HA_1844 [Aggregatibacter aphrophilus NJ8700]